MGSSFRATASDLSLEKLCCEARKYSFFQLTQMIERYINAIDQLGHPQGIDSSRLKLRYRATKSLSFPASDIVELKVNNAFKCPELEMEVAFMGLFGPASPLPAFYTEHILHSDDEWDTNREFLDLINHHLIAKLQDCWEKYRYYTQFQSNGRDDMTQRALKLAGIQSIASLDRLNLEWQRILPLINLFAIKVKNPEGLKAVIHGYFSDLSVDVEECVEREVTIPEDQCHRMGLANTAMGFDLVMGDTVPDRMGKVRIHILNLNPTNFLALLPGTETHAQLTNLISLYARDQFEFDICLNGDSEMNTCFIAEIGDERCRMGWNTCLGRVDAVESFNVVL